MHQIFPNPLSLGSEHPEHAQKAVLHESVNEGQEKHYVNFLFQTQNRIEFTPKRQTPKIRSPFGIICTPERFGFGRTYLEIPSGNWISFIKEILPTTILADFYENSTLFSILFLKKTEISSNFSGKPAVCSVAVLCFLSVSAVSSHPKVSRSSGKCRMDPKSLKNFLFLSQVPQNFIPGA